MFVAHYAIKIVLFALAQKPPGAHISSCLLGILSQDFQARLVRQPGFFLARWTFAQGSLIASDEPGPQLGPHDANR